MYLSYVLVLLALTYLAPALALRPQWLASSRTAIALPIISVAIIGLAKIALSAVGSYDSVTVRTLALAFAGVAVIRVIRWLRSQPRFDWPRPHALLLGFAVLLGLIWAARLGTTAFDTNDEIYSWNLWAMQHALGEPIDLFYTDAPYPQLFAILVSWKYQLLGDFDLQLPLRATLAVIPMVLWGTLAVASPSEDASATWRSAIVMLLLAVAIGRWFGHGLADPLMAAALIVAMHSYLRFRITPDRSGLLVISVIAAGVALFSKQAALIWALFSFPALVALDAFRGRVPPLALLAPATTLAMGLAWILGAGSGFEDNQGVIEASRSGRDLGGQLVYATREWLLGQPLVLALVLTAAIAVFRERSNRDVFLLFLLPALLAWLIFGAYSLRLGIHVVAAAALLILVSPLMLTRARAWAQASRLARALGRHQRAIAVLLAALVLVAAGLQAHRQMKRIGPDFSAYAAGPNTIIRYFGEHADVVLRETWEQPDRLLWVPSNYLYGIYYHRTPMIRPPRRDASSEAPGALLRTLLRERPDFLFDAGDIVPFGPASGVFRTLATQRCPWLFEALASPPNRYGYTLYRLRADEEGVARCLESVPLEAIVQP